MHGMWKVAPMLACLAMLTLGAQASFAGHCYRCTVPPQEPPGYCVLVGLGQPGFSDCTSYPEEGECVINSQSGCTGDAAGSTHASTHVLLEAALLRIGGEAKLPITSVLRLPSGNEGLRAQLNFIELAGVDVTLTSARGWVNEPGQEYLFKADGMGVLGVTTTPVGPLGGAFVHLRSDESFQERVVFNRFISVDECVMATVQLNGERFALILHPVAVELGSDESIRKVNARLLELAQARVASGSTGLVLSAGEPQAMVAR